MQTAPAKNKITDGILLRPRVNRLLSTACKHPLVVVTAGTGYGKSQAVQDYIKTTRNTHLWLQLTPLDNYTTRFWEIFTHAVKTFEPELAAQFAALGFPDTHEKTYRLLQLLAQNQPEEGKFVMVLDDFHKIEDKAILNLIENIAFANLEYCTIILISRYPLPIDYAGLFDNNLLARISVADLRFTLEETIAYYKGIGLNFPPETLANIQRSTEGWPLALHLIGLHRQNDGQLFDDPIDCTIPLLYSLIEVDVFSAYPEAIQKEFIKLSLMDSVPLELVKQLCPGNFRAVSDALRDNHFTYYNAHMGQYHFHRLFRRFLQSKKNTLGHETLMDIYKTAGKWYAGQNKLIEAVTYYEQCRDYEGVFSLVSSYGQDGYSDEIARLCLEKCNNFPPEFIEKNPIVLVFSAHLMLNLGEVERAHQSLLMICAEYESLPRAPLRTAVLGEAYIALAHTSLFKADYAFAGYYRKAHQNLPDGSSIFTPNHEFVGNHHALMLFENTSGSMEKMVNLLFETRPVASQVLNGSGYGLEYLAAAEAAFFQYQFDTAAGHLFQAIYRAREKMQHDILCACHFLLLRTSFAGGDYGKTMQYLRLLEDYGNTTGNSYLYGMDEIGLGWFYANIGKPGMVPRWILAQGLHPKYQAPITLGLEQIIRARCMFEKGQYYELLGQLSDMEQLYQRSNAYFSLLQTHLLRAMCNLRLRMPGDALASFSAAYALAIHNNLILFFVEFGTDMLDLIALAEAENPSGFDTAFLERVKSLSAAYAKKRAFIISSYEKDHKLTPSSPSQLTAREKEILAQLCQGSTREQIARRFGITLNTVKTNLKHIYTKMGALNSADAVRIALENGIFDS